MAASAKGRLTFIHLTEDTMFNTVCSLATILVAVCVAAECAESTAYGRFAEGSTVALDARLGWWLMELPCSVVFAYQWLCVGGPQAHRPVPRLLAALFIGHYAYRGWIFPALMRVHPGTKSFSAVPALGSWLVTCTHAYLSARWFAEHGTHLADGRRWARSPRVWLGGALYYSGLAMLVYHDAILRELRPCPAGARYCIPTRGLFARVTCAQYTSELVAWLGFALLTGPGPNGLFILAVSLGNLLPRAAATHAWWLERFGDEYARLGRDRLIPGVW